MWEPTGRARMEGGGKCGIQGTSEALGGVFRKGSTGMPQVALWGETAQGTREAVEHYIRDHFSGYSLSGFLALAWK